MDLETRLKNWLAETEAQGLLRAPPTVEAGAGSVSIGGRTLISFASNDYLGLAQHPALTTALAEAASRSAGAGSSRVVAGTTPPHRSAEQALAGQVRQPAARLFSSAYAANLAVLAGLFGRGDLILSDSLNHASLIDGCRLSRARTEVFPHRDLDALAHLLRTHRASARVAAIVTESAFSMDGDLADVAALRALADEHDAALVVDEAHALGVMGPLGQGLCIAAGVDADIVIGGLGKAFGLAGGFAAGSALFARAIDNFGRTFVFSTAILPAIAAAVPTSVDLVRTAEAARARLQRHAAALRRAAGPRALGAAPGVIVPVLVGAPDEAIRVQASLRERGLFVPAMRPPTVPVGSSRLRITPTALHTETEIETLASALRAELA